MRTSILETHRFAKKWFLENKAEKPSFQKLSKMGVLERIAEIENEVQYKQCI